MSLAPGVQLGPYEVTSLLGAGGMGEVYQARDTKLNRDVALKVLPDAFTLDPDRLARFKREAQVLASLNHPNIGAIYGLEDANGVQALVLELVDGPTLADRIAEGPLPLDEVLPIAKQIAEALEAAHERGIIHRDLKPANVKLTRDGAVKVLDFGLAKALASDPAGASAGAQTHSPTITSPAMTQVGMILGTAAYMSPEQAKGREADKRSDIWAFGCVLFEMLAGKRAFEAEDVSDTLAAVLRGEPEWHALPADLPDHLRLLLHRCLERDRTKRVGEIGTARFLIEQPLGQRPVVDNAAAAPAPRQPVWKRALPAIVSAAAAASVVATGAWLLRAADAPKIVTRLSYSIPDDQRFNATSRPVLAISPDGTRIAYVADNQLYLKAMWDAEASPIRGTQFVAGGGSTMNPVFSPDGQSIAFWAQREIRKIGIAGGAAVTVVRDVDSPYGLSWDPSGLLFGSRQGVSRIPDSGGPAEVLISPRENEAVHGPQMLPDGRTVLFTVATDQRSWDSARIVVQKTGTDERKTIVEGGTDGRYLPSGHIVYATRGVVFGIPFDPGTLETIGGAQTVLEGVSRAVFGTTGSSHFAVSRTGSLVFISGPAAGSEVTTDLAISDMKGTVRMLRVPRPIYEAPRFSPDGGRIAVGIGTLKGSDVWIYDVAGNIPPRQLTFGGKNRFPIWPPDGTRVAFQSDRDGDQAIWWQRVDGGTPAERLTKPARGEEHVPDGFFPTGDRIMVSVRAAGRVSLWTYTLADQKITPYIQNQFSVLPHAAVSPDGLWVAYTVSAAQGDRASSAVFVQPFPATGAIYSIPIVLGVNPFWSPDGKSIYAASPSATAFSVVGVTTRQGFSVTTQPRQVQRPSPVGGGAQQPSQYAIAPDGEHFVIVVSSSPSDAASRPRIDVVLNWHEELKRLVPLK